MLCLHFCGTFPSTARLGVGAGLAEGSRGLHGKVQSRPMFCMADVFTLIPHPVEAAGKAVLDLHWQTYRDHDERFRGAHLDRMIEGVAGMIDEAAALGPDACCIWLAKEGDRPVGSAAFLRRGNRAQLRWVAVLPGMRGHGLGRRLVEQVIAHARKSGCQDIYLKTVDRLEASMALYRALGFKTVREEILPLWFGEGCEIEMVLPLKG